MKRELRKHGNRINYRDKDQPRKSGCQMSFGDLTCCITSFLVFFFLGFLAKKVSCIISNLRGGFVRIFFFSCLSNYLRAPQCLRIICGYEDEKDATADTRHEGQRICSADNSFFSLIFRVDKPFLPRRFVEPCGKCKFGGGKNQKKNTEIC